MVLLSIMVLIRDCFGGFWWKSVLSALSVSGGLGNMVGRKLVRILKDWRVEMEGWSVYEVTYSKDSMEACQVG